MMDFSKPIVTTKNGRPSDKRTILMGTPSLVVVTRPNKNAKRLERSTETANQAFEPSRFMLKNKEMKVRYIDRYPRVIITISRVSACCSGQCLGFGQVA